MNAPDTTKSDDQSPPPDSSTVSQEDSAARVQADVVSANEECRENAPPAEHKATQFDGSPNPEAAEDDIIHPRDDTPYILPTKEGP